jgi:hypothetical protein
MHNIQCLGGVPGSKLNKFVCLQLLGVFLGRCSGRRHAWLPPLRRPRHSPPQMRLQPHQNNLQIRPPPANAPSAPADGGRSLGQQSPRAGSGRRQILRVNRPHRHQPPLTKFLQPRDHRGPAFRRSPWQRTRDRDPPLGQRRVVEGAHGGGDRGGPERGPPRQFRGGRSVSEWDTIVGADAGLPLSDLNQLEDVSLGRITRIVTQDFPQYFAVVSRIRQEVHAIGPEGGMVSSTVVPQVQAVFPQGALTKKIKVGLQVNLFKPRKGVPKEKLRKITVNHIPKKKRWSLIW